MGASYPGRAVRRADGEHPGRPARRRADQVFRRLDRARRQGRTAENQADAAARRRAQRRGHHLGLGRPEEVSARPDRVGPAQPDGQRLRPALRLSPNTRPTCSPSSIPRPTPSPISRRRCAMPIPPKALDPAMPPWPSRSALRRTGARRSSTTPRSTTTTPCSTRRAGCGWRRRCAVRRTRTSARRAPTIPRPSCSRWSRPTVRWRSSIPRR